MPAKTPATAPLPADDRLIVALDLPSADKAYEFVNRMGPAISYYKVGFELFTAAGPQIVGRLKDMGKKVFLDLKFHDIPNTVAAAIRAASRLRLDMLTVHAAGGEEMLRGAMKAAQDAEKPPTVLAVTVLTSMNDAAIRQVGFAATPSELVARLAELAQRAGCNGIVCSAEENAGIRKQLGNGLKILNGGIRPAGSERGDQARIGTPKDALKAGADYLVVGRPITAAKDPHLALRKILEEMQGKA